MNTLDDSPERLAAANAALARRRAIKRGDEGSPIRLPELCQCGHCHVRLTHEVRSHIMGVCRRCLEESLALQLEAKRRFEKSQAEYVAQAKAKPTLLRRFLSLFSRGRGRK